MLKMQQRTFHHSCCSDSHLPPHPPLCDCYPFISQPHWEKLPTVTIPLSANPPRTTSKDVSVPTFQPARARKPQQQQQKTSALLQFQQGGNAYAPTANKTRPPPNTRSAHQHAAGISFGSGLSATTNNTATIAALCDEDRSRLAALVSHLALAQDQKTELKMELDALKEGLNEVTLQLEKTNAEKGSVVARNKAITRRLHKAEALLRQYQVEIDNTKAQVLNLQDGVAATASGDEAASPPDLERVHRKQHHPQGGPPQPQLGERHEDQQLSTEKEELIPNLALGRSQALQEETLTKLQQEMANLTALLSSQKQYFSQPPPSPPITAFTRPPISLPDQGPHISSFFSSDGHIPHPVESGERSASESSSTAGLNNANIDNNMRVMGKTRDINMNNNSNKNASRPAAETPLPTMSDVLRGILQSQAEKDKEKQSATRRERRHPHLHQRRRTRSREHYHRSKKTRSPTRRAKLHDHNMEPLPPRASSPHRWRDTATSPTPPTTNPPTTLPSSFSEDNPAASIRITVPLTQDNHSSPLYTNTDNRTPAETADALSDTSEDLLLLPNMYPPPPPVPQTYPQCPLCPPSPTKTAAHPPPPRPPRQPQHQQHHQHYAQPVVIHPTRSSPDASLLFPNDTSMIRPLIDILDEIDVDSSATTNPPPNRNNNMTQQPSPALHQSRGNQRSQQQQQQQRRQYRAHQQNQQQENDDSDDVPLRKVPGSGSTRRQTNNQNNSNNNNNTRTQQLLNALSAADHNSFPFNDDDFDDPTSTTFTTTSSPSAPSRTAEAAAAPTRPRHHPNNNNRTRSSWPTGNGNADADEDEDELAGLIRSLNFG
ncbi:hypothetical protein DFJ77DRAFT_45551 [Powellomyces hirtus]|nr:hypothetical protein DFJ77DRAFT_45551 [Powellomyces hirtus]